MENIFVKKYLKLAMQITLVTSLTFSGASQAQENGKQCLAIFGSKIQNSIVAGEKNQGRDQLESAAYDQRETEILRGYAKLIEFNPNSLQEKFRVRVGGKSLSTVNNNNILSEHIMYGFESEYTLDKHAIGVLQFYGPHESLGVSTQQWLQMSGETKLAWIKDNMKKLFPEKRIAGKLQKINRDQKWSFLPEHLILDSTGNLEIVLSPVNSLEIWYAQVTQINSAMGAGSMQSTVSLPSNIFFGKNAENLFSVIGFFSLVSEYDPLMKLYKGYQRTLKNPDVEAAKSFNHPYLGPMSKLKFEKLEDALITHANSTNWGNLDYVSGTDSSYKYLGTTVYRPDLAGPNRIIVEIRDAHSDMDHLLRQVLRTTYFMQSGMNSLTPAMNFVKFDTVNVFEKQLPLNVKKVLRELFPTKTKPGEEYTPEELLALDTFRNFSYPLRDWSKHIEFLQVIGLDKKVKSAQVKYLDNLSLITSEFQSGKIDKSVAGKRIQSSLVDFVKDSGLAESFQIWEKQQIENKIQSNQMLIGIIDIQDNKDAA